MKPSGVVRLSALYIAAVFCILLTGLLTIAHEISGQFRQILVSLTGHHWVTMSIFSGLIFIALLFITSYALRSERITRVMKADSPFLWSILLVVITLLLITVLLVVYILHYTA